MLTGRSRKYLEHCGYIVSLVERSVDVPKVKGQPFGERFRQKFDAFGIADLVAVKPERTGTVYVQTTDFSHAAEHKEKILAAKASPILLSAGNHIELHLWKSSRQKGRKYWKLHVLPLVPIIFDKVMHFADPQEKWFLDNMQEIEDF